MAYSYVLLPGDGSNTNFAFNFGYLSRSHIHVSVDEVDTPFTFLSDFTVQITPAPALGTIVKVYRTTPLNQPIVDWTDGTVLTEEDMDLNTLFSLYAAQESWDQVMASIRQDGLGRWDGLGREAINFADPTSASGLVTKGYFDSVYTPQLDQKIADANVAIDSKVTAATTQANNAANSASASASSASTAAGFATAAENHLKTFKGQYYGELASAPTVDPNGDPPSTGDLYFDTTANEMRVFRSDGQWKPAGSTIEGILKRPPGNTPIIATAGQTEITITGGYDPGNVIVIVNGVTITAPDVDTTSGTKLVFNPALSAGDEVDFYAFGAFQVADLRAEVVTVEPAGGISSTNVQDALEELDTEIQNLPAGSDLQWLGIPVGMEFPLHPNAPLPPTDNPDFRYIILTAGLDGPGQYNEGVLTDETVTGSDPTITATAVVSLTGSPLDGQQIDLINTSRVFLRPGPAAGAIVDSQNLAHNHTASTQYAYMTRSLSGGSFGGSGIAFGYSASVAVQSSGGTEAAPRHIPRVYLMRIL